MYSRLAVLVALSLAACGGQDPAAPRISEASKANPPGNGPAGLVAIFSDGVIGDGFTGYPAGWCCARVNVIMVTRTVLGPKNIMTIVDWTIEPNHLAGPPEGQPGPGAPTASGIDTIPNEDFVGDAIHAELHTALNVGRFDIVWDADPQLPWTLANSGICSGSHSSTLVSFATATATLFGYPSFADSETDLCLWNFRGRRASR
jgi:hypothetical protein